MADEGGVGKAVADAWRARNPGKKYDRKIDYTSCDGRPLLVAAGNGVNAYTEADREWMELAIHAYYAAKAAGGATVAKKKK